MATITCPNVDTICGTTSKPFECQWGEYNDDLSQCICSVGYTGSQCSSEDTDLVTEATLASDSDITYNATNAETVCIEGITGDYSGFNGYYYSSGENEGIPSFYNSKINYIGTYLYYRRYGNDWSLGDSKGDSGRYGYCSTPVGDYDDPNIEECGSWYFPSGGAFVAQQGVTATYDAESCDGETGGTGDPGDDSYANNLQINFLIQFVIVAIVFCFNG